MKKKKLVSLLMVAALGVSTLLSGCGDSSDASSAGSDKEYDNSYCADGTPSDTLTELRQKGTLIVGSSGDAPFAYVDQETGEFAGVDAEIIKEVGKRLGIDHVEMSLVTFSELILNLNQGNIDLIADCMYTRADRAEQIYFGDIWYTQGGGLLVSEESSMNGPDDFDASSTVIGYTEGTIWQTVAEGWAEDGLIKEARSTGDQSSSIVALQYGKIDGFVTDSTVCEDLFANSPETVEGLVMAENYEDTEATIGRIAPAVAFDDIAFMKEINNVVVELRDEGFIDKVFEEYGLSPELHAITNDERACTVNTRDE